MHKRISWLIVSLFVAHLYCMYLKDLLIRSIYIYIYIFFFFFFFFFISYFKCMVLYVYKQEVSKQKVLDTMYDVFT